jgi:limonene-1,2-epoxide hydrolase
MVPGVCSLTQLRKESMTMADHPHVAIYREVHEKLQQGNFEAAFDALDDDVVWHQLGAETLYGKDAVVASMSGMEEFGADAFEIDIHDVSATTSMSSAW